MKPEKQVVALLIGDPHFKVNNIPMVEKFIKKTEDHLQSCEKPYNFIICMGDLLDTFERIHIHPFKKSIEFLKMTSNYAHTFLIIGNHERENNSDFQTNIHAFVALKGVDKITIIDKAKIVKTSVCNFLFVPYVPPGRFEEAILTVGEKDEDIEDILDNNEIVTVFAHQEIRGAKMGFITSSDGDVWPSERPLLVSGHIHQFQKIGDNVLYIGTPFQHDFDEDSDKALSVLKWTLKDNDTIISHSRFSLNLPIKKNLQYQIKDIMESDVNNMAPIIEMNKEKDVMFRIELIGTTVEYKCFLNSEQHLKLQSRCKIKTTIIKDDGELQLPNNNNIVNLNIPTKNFTEIILEKIMNNPKEKELMQIYKNIFIS